jgi:spermidine synthase
VNLSDFNVLAANFGATGAGWARADFTGDARVTLADEPTDSADVLIGDAFSARSVPWHLATVEFAREIRRVLRPGGTYALNVIDQPPLKLVRAEVATLREVFGAVAVVAPPEGGGNFVVLASDAPLNAVRPTRGGRLQDGDFADGAEPLRDLDAPADQLLSRGS